MSYLAMVLMVLCVPAALAQLSAVPSAAELREQVRKDAAVYDAKLPSLSCHESSVITEWKHGAVKATTRFEGTIRVQRTGDANDPMHETHTFDLWDGVPVEPNERVNMAYWLTGAFANGLGHTGVEADVCFDARAQSNGTGWELDLTRRPGTDDLQVCKDHALPGSRKTLLMNVAGDVTHMDRTLPPDVAKHKQDASFAAMDFRPVTLGTQTLWLPARMESHDEKDERRLEVRYSECKLFGGSITILPDVVKVPEP